VVELNNRIEILYNFGKAFQKKSGMVFNAPILTF